MRARLGWALCTALLAPVAIMCGGRAAVDSAGHDGGTGVDGRVLVDSSLFDDVRRTPDCGHIGTVLGGEVYVGAWQYSASQQAFSPAPTCDALHPGNKRITVKDFLLMNEPATNACYFECVNEGICAPPSHDVADPNPLPWDDPHRAGEPAYLDYPTASAFCAWIGGYIPSLAQLLLAAQTDAPTPSVAAMTDAAIGCDGSTTSSQICQQISQMDLSNPNNGLYDVGKVTRDCGPYWHCDLFGDGSEWTRTFVNFTSTEFCSLPDGAPDFVTFGTAQYTTVQFATDVLAALREAQVSGSATMAPGTVDPSTVSYQRGFRCAFDSILGAGTPTTWAD